jgi:hypothetical protein
VVERGVHEAQRDDRAAQREVQSPLAGERIGRIAPGARTCLGNASGFAGVGEAEEVHAEIR